MLTPFTLTRRSSPGGVSQRSCQFGLSHFHFVSACRIQLIRNSLQVSKLVQNIYDISKLDAHGLQRHSRQMFYLLGVTVTTVHQKSYLILLFLFLPFSQELWFQEMLMKDLEQNDLSPCKWTSTMPMPDLLRTSYELDTKSRFMLSLPNSHGNLTCCLKIRKLWLRDIKQLVCLGWEDSGKPRNKPQVHLFLKYTVFPFQNLEVMQEQAKVFYR